jgi:hypothetical protein
LANDVPEAGALVVGGRGADVVGGRGAAVVTGASLVGGTVEVGRSSSLVVVVASVVDVVASVVVVVSSSIGEGSLPPQADGNKTTMSTPIAVVARRAERGQMPKSRHAEVIRLLRYGF